MGSATDDRPSRPSRGMGGSQGHKRHAALMVVIGARRYGLRQKVPKSGILRRVSDVVRLTPHPLTPKCDEDGAPATRIAPYRPVVEPCAVCPAHCCHLHVKVSVADAVALCRAIDVPLSAAVVVRTVAPHEHSFAVDDDPRILRSSAGWTGHAELQLVHDDDTGRCQQLVDIGGYQRCGVYAARPTGCRTYPVGWETDTQKGGPGSVACPVAYAIRPQDERQFIAHVELAIERWAAHRAIVDAWNQRDTHPLDDFFAHALSAAGAEDVAVGGDAQAQLYALQVATGVLPG